jgi:hypothetical protein
MSLRAVLMQLSPTLHSSYDLLGNSLYFSKYYEKRCANGNWLHANFRAQRGTIFGGCHEDAKMTASKLTEFVKRIARAFAALDIGFVPRGRSFRAHPINPTTGMPLVGPGHAVDSGGNFRNLPPHNP